jgi:hypothetical protein
MSETSLTAPSRSLTTEYVVVAGILTATIGALVSITSAAPSFDAEPRALLAPVFAMALLTAAVWTAMVLVRNISVMRGVASTRYYEAYRGDMPPDWIERPARTFNNLMQVPTLFYVACVFMVALHRIDPAAVALAWLFVAIRSVHAIVYIVWNRVSLRFATFTASCITLAVLWARFAAATL